MDGQAYRAHEHGADIWHGHPVGWREVPPAIRRDWLLSKLVAKKDINRNW